ncbi:MAG: hypothetical protein JSR48_10465 [Verrucomicrobia bacterium]|nr:hypothetical protein [Verrucomicrobiota bacterium]
MNRPDYPRISGDLACLIGSLNRLPPTTLRTIAHHLTREERTRAYRILRNLISNIKP